MVAKPDDDRALTHMIDACTSIEKLISGIEYHEWLANSTALAAVCWYLVRIGEISRRGLSDEITKGSRIDWLALIALRNRVVHEYDKTNMREVWHTVRVDLPQLTEDLKRLRAAAFGA